MLEAENCGQLDGSTDSDSEFSPPEPPVPSGEPMPVDQNQEEAVSGGAWLHLIWTGEHFSFIFGRPCTLVSMDRCLGMRRFGKDGMRIGPDWVYRPTSPDESIQDTSFASHDICWNGTGYGLAWVEVEVYPYEERIYNAYFQRLNKDGKPISNPILLNSDIIMFCPYTAPCTPFPYNSGEAPIRVGCSPANYLVGYPYDVAWSEVDWGNDWILRYLNLHLLSESGETVRNEYYGYDETPYYLCSEGIRKLGDAWHLIHTVDSLGMDLLVGQFQQDLEISWRNALSSGPSLVFDWDVDKGREKLAVTFSTESENYFVIMDASGRIEHASRILEEYPNAVARIASIGNGLYALLYGTCSCNGPEYLRLVIINESGQASVPVEVLTTINYLWIYPHNMKADVTWTGDEIAVVALTGDGITGNHQAYLQLLLP